MSCCKEDCSLSVLDNGRGIPTRIIPESGKNAIEHVFTELMFRSQLNIHGEESGYDFHRMRGAGASVVNALSEWFECTVRREGKIYRMRFERGLPVTTLENIGDCSEEEHGTQVAWLADRTMFKPALNDAGNLRYEDDLIAKRLRELAYLLPGGRITFQDRLNGKALEIFHFPNGVADYVRDRNGGQDVFPAEPIAIRGSVGKIRVEVALQYSDTDGETILGFANRIPTPENGTRITGFLRALTSIVNSLVVPRTKHKGETIRHRLTAVIAVNLPNPMWYGSSTNRLMNVELEGIVYSIMYAGLKGYFRDNPEIARAMAERLVDG